MAASYLEQGISLVIDQLMRYHRQLDHFINLSKIYAYPLVRVELFCHSDTSLKRVIDRQYDRDIKVPEDRIKNNIRKFEKSESVDLSIDPTLLTTNEVLEKVRSLLYEKGVKEKRST